MSGDISTLLVANRGEIALRIMRTARAMGLRVIAVYSDADASAAHVRFADDAVRIGPPPVAESYLSIPAILAAARQSGATAIHPGYGFLSENATFARAVSDAGLTFVGPPPEAVEIMGDKACAKRAMIAAGVPCVPGYEGEDQNDKAFIGAAAKIGFPVMVKAAAGGGGRGMRLVAHADDLANALKQARTEAQNAFGSSELILERALQGARHVEVQVFADAHGATIHLGERDCSVQRRHQKVIEESPCPVMTPELRQRMGEAAVQAARAVDYRGAGTVEFLLDGDGQFYFLEMNTRLQVEHPVTEMVTGLDLVTLQLRVARGEPLGLAQSDVTLSGWAIEARIYAEDPEAGFLPSTGHLLAFHTPTNFPGVRIDAGVESGDEVSPWYDSMIAKVIAHGETRDEARQRLVHALQSTAVFGPRSNRDFLIDLLKQDAFAAGQATTAFIPTTYGEAGYVATIHAELYAVGAVLQHTAQLLASSSEALDVSADLLEWTSAGELHTVVVYEIDGARQTIRVRPDTRNRYSVQFGAQTFDIAVRSLSPGKARLSVNGRGVEVLCRNDNGLLHMATEGRSLAILNFAVAPRTKAEGPGQGVVLAPMHGRLLEIFVAPGDTVRKGDRLAILEAMKMQHEITAEIDGRVSAVSATANTQIAARDLILEIEPVAGDVA